ncbi:MAG: CDP-glycerol glycerophosphotransferase family protein [Mycoplasmatales bacterium]|nr:CDP-glycerol glycerophosphotransferase family protein [Mycoplasmatales bacterium]
MLKNKWKKWKKIKAILTLFNIIYYQFFKALRFKKKYIIFQSFMDEKWGEYEEEIFLEVYERFKKTHKIIWISGVVPSKHANKKIQIINPWSIKAPIVLAKAKYLISGTYSKMFMLSKNTKVFYLNHGYSVKTMGNDWVNETKGIKRFIRKICADSQHRQIDMCFAHDEYDAKAIERVFNHNGKKKTQFIINGFPHLNKYEKGEDVLFLPSWHEKSEIKFPTIKSKNKYVSLHPRTKIKNIPKGWTIVTTDERKDLKLKYVISDNSSAPIEYIKSGIQVYWIDAKYDRDFCKEFREKYGELLIDPDEFHPLGTSNYNKIVKQIIEAPYGKDSVKFTVDKMNIE